MGNLHDAEQLEPAIARITTRAGVAPTAVTADRGYGFAKIDQALGALGVGTVAIPRAGKPGVTRAALQISDPFTEMPASVHPTGTALTNQRPRAAPVDVTRVLRATSGPARRQCRVAANDLEGVP